MRAFFKSPLCVTLAIVLLGVLTQALQAFDHVYWNVWFKNRTQSAPANAVIVSLDNGAPLNAASVAGSTALQAQLLTRLMVRDGRHIYVDMPAAAGMDVAGDNGFSTAVGRGADIVTLVVRSRVDPAFNRSFPAVSKFAPPAGAKLAVSAWDVNFLGFAERTDPTFPLGDNIVPAVSAAMFGHSSASQHIYPDFRFNPRAVPIIDARDVLRGGANMRSLAGRQIFVTSTNITNNSVLRLYGSGEIPAAFADIAGYKGIANGRIIEFGWLLLLCLFSLLVIFGHNARSRRDKIAIYTVLTFAVVILPGVLREWNVISSVAPAMAAMAIYAPLRSSQKWRHRVQLTSSASGLPNIAAMAAGDRIAQSCDVVAVSVSQYEQMLASLPRELHGECARQIARRLSLGAGDRPVYDNDNGHFVWLEESKTLDALVEHLNGLHALFASPLVIDGHILDTTVHFGIDRNTESSAISRIQAALASANEAQGKGKLYEEFGEQRLAQSPWDLSLHARIDEALRNGDIWLALQPQYDFRSRRISGAEALIRWNDPVRGAIPPDNFILQAERAGRIEAITFWVMERAIAMLDELRFALPFQISVNLSARIVDHPTLVQRISDIVRETGLKDCGSITFEVTETFSMANREQARINLAELRAMGFRLSIDDFGMGQAGLAYLAEIPSDEIKLDRRFIQRVTTDRRERLIVESMIGLAHALGQEVVAEGIEDVLTLEALRKMGCDLAQGYYIGRPMALPDLIAYVALNMRETKKVLGANI